MLLGFTILAAFALALLLMGWLSAESRPDFLNPTKKHAKFIAPFRLDE
jgi:hypothetical protein